MNKKILIIFLLFAFVDNINGQIATSSPYSRFGLGELHQNVSADLGAMGGVYTALINPKYINPKNPASYTSFSSNSFLFSTGGWHQTTRFQTTDNQQISNNNGLSHFILGFPLSKKMGFSCGLIPFSSTGYKISDKIVDINNNKAIANYYGDGGISKLYFGGGYEISEDLSLGINASYLFGGLNRRKQLIYDNASLFNSRSVSRINLRGYYYELGFIYKKFINENEEIAVGLTFNNNSTIRAKRTQLVESFETVGVIELVKDTFSNSTFWGDVVLPKHNSLGISYTKNKQWVIAVDYSTQNWQEFLILNESDDLGNSNRMALGIQFTPDYSSITNYFKRIDFRAGLSFSNIPLQFNNNQLEERSVSFGIGIPVKKSRTKYDISCIIGDRGTTNDNLIREQFIRLGLSISYDGIWFVKRKYD